MFSQNELGAVDRFFHFLLNNYIILLHNILINGRVTTSRDYDIFKSRVIYSANLIYGYTKKEGRGVSR